MKHRFHSTSPAGERHNLHIELKHLRILRRQRVTAFSLSDNVVERLSRMIRIRHQRLAAL